MGKSKLTVNRTNVSSGLVLPVLDNDPGDGVVGRIAYVNGELKYYDGESWWWVGDTEKGGGLAITNGLILRLDSTDNTSYPGTGSI